MTVLAVTGHRTKRLLGEQHRVNGVRTQKYEIRQHALEFLQAVAQQKLSEIKPEKVLIGMALGWDTVVAKACLNMEIPYVAVVPCDNQDSVWPSSDRNTYRHLLKLAAEVVNVSPGPYETWKMFVRNEYLVDNCDQLLALWDGEYTGGTGRCIAYAERQSVRNQKPKITNVWSQWVTKFYELRNNWTSLKDLEP